MTLTIYEDLEQGSPEWLQARCGIVTASTVGKLLTAGGKVANNDTSRGLIETLTLERVTGRVQTIPPTFDMRRGTALEDDARNVYAERYGPVTQVGFGRIDEDSYSFGASPDGLIGGGIAGLEIKCPKPSTHFRTLLEGEVPRIYLPQIHGNMLVFDAGAWHFMSHAPGMPPFVTRINRDARWDEKITDAVQRAENDIRSLTDQYQRNIRGNPPAPYWDPFDEGEEIE